MPITVMIINDFGQMSGVDAESGRIKSFHPVEHVGLPGDNIHQRVIY
jgi:hypothetical protein